MKVLIVCTLLIVDSLAVKNAEDYFYNYHDDLTELIWKHGVHNKDALIAALADKDVHMIQADVFFPETQTEADEKSDPIIIDGSNFMTLADYLQKVIDSNKKTNSAKKGLKLDFKSAKAFGHSVRRGVLLNEFGALRSEIDFPLWVGAQVVEGPNGGRVTEIVLDKMNLKKITSVTVALEWTTKESTKDDETYTKNQIDDMDSMIEQLEITDYEVVYVSRAVYAGRSSDLKKLIKNKRKLLVWSPKDEEETKSVKISGIESLYKDHEDSVYLDIDENLRDKLNSGVQFLPLATLIMSCMVALIIF